MKKDKRVLKANIHLLEEAISSKCLDCVCYQPGEVLLCEIRQCPLFPFKPVRLVGLYALAKKLKKIEAKNS